MRKHSLGIGLFAALLVAVALTGNPHPQKASAQALTYSPFGQNTAVGTFIGVANVQDSVLYDGELVMADTNTTAITAGGVRRIGVRHYDGGNLNKSRVLGIVAGDIPKSSKRGTGRVLIWGYHPAAYLNASNIAANALISASATNSCLGKQDTLSAVAGYAIGRSSAATSTVNTGPRYRYKVYFFGTRLAGAAL